MSGLSQLEIKQQLQEMDPYEFEELVAEIWELQGYQTTVSQGSGDRGIDVEATKESPFDQKVLIQAKRYGDGNNVGSEEVRNYATLYQQVPDTDTVVIVTTGYFTPEAENLGQDLNVKQVDGDDLTEIILENKELVEQHFKDSESSAEDSSTEIWSLEGIKVSDEIKTEFRTRAGPETTIHTGDKDRDTILEILKSGLEANYEDRDKRIDFQVSWDFEDEWGFSDLASIIVQYVEIDEDIVESQITIPWSEYGRVDYEYLKKTGLESEFDCTIKSSDHPTMNFGLPVVARQFNDGDYEQDLNIILHIISRIFEGSVDDISSVMYLYI